jgi:hypothetical protein
MKVKKVKKGIDKNRGSDMLDVEGAGGEKEKERTESESRGVSEAEKERMQKQ